MLLHGLCSLCDLNILPRDAQLNTSNGYDYVILWILCAMLAKARDHGVCTLLCDMFGGPSLLDIDGSCITRSRTHTHDWGDHTIEYLFCCIFHLVIIFPNTHTSHPHVLINTITFHLYRTFTSFFAYHIVHTSCSILNTHTHVCTHVHIHMHMIY